MGVKVLTFLLNYIESGNVESHLFYGEDSIPHYSFGSEYLKTLTLEFNKIFNEKLLAKKEIVNARIPGNKVVLWEIGNVVVKSGLRYWVPRIYKGGWIDSELVIPKFLFRVLKEYGSPIVRVDNFNERLSEARESLKEPDREIHRMYLEQNQVKLDDYRLPKIREPQCELDLVFLIGRYWKIIKERTGLEDIVFVDKHWDAEGTYKGKKVRIEVKVDAKNFDKDPEKIDVLICWRVSPSMTTLGKIFKADGLQAMVMAYKCLGGSFESDRITSKLVKACFRCVGVEVIELSELFKE